MKLKNFPNKKPKRSSPIRKGFRYQDLQALRLALELYIEKKTLNCIWKKILREI